MKISVYIGISLDGFIAREDGTLDFLDGPEEIAGEDYGYHEFLDSVDVLVMGRNTYEMVQSFGQWPYGSKRVVVLSSRPIQIPEEQARTVEWKSCSPAELVQDLSESGAKHLYIDGGKTIQGFIEAGLISEIIITRIPVLIGSGIPLFGPLSDEKILDHVETRSFDNGLVQSKYRIVEK